MYTSILTAHIITTDGCFQFEKSHLFLQHLNHLVDTIPLPWWSWTGNLVYFPAEHTWLKTNIPLEMSHAAAALMVTSSNKLYISRKSYKLLCTEWENLLITALPINCWWLTHILIICDVGVSMISLKLSDINVHRIWKACGLWGLANMAAILQMALSN